MLSAIEARVAIPVFAVAVRVTRFVVLVLCSFTKPAAAEFGSPVFVVGISAPGEAISIAPVFTSQTLASGVIITFFIEFIFVSSHVFASLREIRAINLV
jgi:hypothetical protein